MIELIKPEENTFHIRIYSPRDNQDEIEFINFLKRFLQLDSFGMVLEVEGSSKFSPDGKRELTTWFKKNKVILSQKCVGFARVNPEVKKVDASKIKAFALAMPCPYTVVEKADQAYEWISSKKA